MRTKKNRNIQEHECKICNKYIAGNKHKLDAHLYVHKAVSGRFRCSICSKEFYRSDTYLKHVQKHSGKVKKGCFICDHCDRSFVEKRNLVLHLRVHDDSPSCNYKCVACGVQYCEERLLKYHIRKTHFNLCEAGNSHLEKGLNETWVERVKESEICVEITKINDNVLSIRKSAVIKKEDEVNPKLMDEKAKFKDYISSVFAQQDNSQYSKAKCDYCHKEMLKKSLLSHIRERHLKLRKFKCDVCGYSFARHYQLVDHICGKVRRRRKVEKNLHAHST